AARAQRANLGLWIRRREDRVPGDEGVRAGLPHARYRISIDSAIDLERGAAALFVEYQPRSPNLVDRIGNELLPTESRVHRHDQHEIDLWQYLADVVERRGRVERHPGTTAELADSVELPVKVRRDLRVNRHAACAGAGEIVEILLRLDDHEVDVERKGC